MLGMSTETISQVIAQDSTENQSELQIEEISKSESKDKSKKERRITGYRASYVSILGGAGYYNVSFNPTIVPTPTGNISPVFGVSYRYESPLNKSIEIELRYRTSGWQDSNLYARDLGILELPILAHVSFGKKKTKAFFTLGETVTFIISEKEEILDPSSDSYFYDQPIDNKVGFALNLGVGAIRYFEKGAIQFEVRGTLALTNLYKPDNELFINSSNAYFIEGVIKYMFRVK